MQVALDVFDLHNRIVHQHANNQREGQQGDGVDRKAQVGHADKGGNDRQWQGHSRHQRAAQIAQEQPHHNHRQNRTLIKHDHGRIKLFGHRRHKVKSLGEFNVGVLSFEFIQGQLHGGAHLHLAGAFAAGDLKAHHGHAIEHGQRPGLGHGVFDGGYLVQAHALAVAQGQFQTRQFFHGLDRGQRAHGLFAAAQISPATGTFGLHLTQLARHIGGCGPQRL